MLIDDYQILVAADDLPHALGAGLELVDLCLRIAATPASTAADGRHKAAFFELHFSSMARSFDHGHVARIANAAVTAEQALATSDSTTRQ